MFLFSRPIISLILYNNMIELIEKEADMKIIVSERMRYVPNKHYLYKHIMNIPDFFIHQ